MYKLQKDIKNIGYAYKWVKVETVVTLYESGLKIIRKTKILFKINFKKLHSPRWTNFFFFG